MLVLSRKIGEAIVINEEIEITVVKMTGDRVRLGINAPRQRSIRRGELPARDTAPRAAVDAENSDAADGHPGPAVIPLEPKAT